jgi:hypothetical protein
MRKLRWIGIALLVGAGIAGIRVYTERRARATVDMASVEEDIRQHISIGTSRRDVEAYLDQKGVPHSYTDESKEFPEYRHTEGAMIPETTRSPLVKADIQILFRFDNRDALVDYKLQEIFTGP